MNKFPKHSGHRRRLSPIVMIIVALIVIFSFWQIVMKKIMNKHKIPTATEIDSLNVVPEEPADSLNVDEPETQPTEITIPATQKLSQYPAAPQIESRKPRMLKDGLYILIVKDQHKLHLYNDGKKIKDYTVALGKNPEDKRAVGDLRTPEGHFYINFIRDSTSWTHDFGDGKGEVPDAYGPWFMALYTGKTHTFSQNTWTGIGIHGTHRPQSIGTNETEGCIRMYNNELIELKNIIGDNPFVSVDIVASL